MKIPVSFCSISSGSQLSRAKPLLGDRFCLDFAICFVGLKFPSIDNVVYYLCSFIQLKPKQEENQLWLIHLFFFSFFWKKVIIWATCGVVGNLFPCRTQQKGWNSSPPGSWCRYSYKILLGLVRVYTSRWSIPACVLYCVSPGPLPQRTAWTHLLLLFSSSVTVSLALPNQELSPWNKVGLFYKCCKAKYWKVHKEKWAVW